MKSALLPSILQKLLTESLDFIFPPSDTERLLRSISSNTLDNLYQPKLFKNVIYLASYNKTEIRASITENKFYNNKLAVNNLNYLFQKWAKSQTKKTLFVTIPLGRKRQRDRGYNQVDNFLNADPSNKVTTAKLLKRKIETDPQSQLDKKSRVQNIKNVFAYNTCKVNFSNYEQIVLVDDVITTGTTLAEARATLAPHLPHHITLKCLAIAH